MLQQRILRSFQAASRNAHPIRSTRSPSTPFVSSRFSRPATSSFPPTRRQYSQEAEAKREEQPNTEQQTAQEPAKEDAAQLELETKKREVIDLTDRLKRSVAEYRNLQEQTKREVAAAREFSLQRFAKDILDTVDNLDRALETVPKEKLTSDNPDLMNLHSGLKMTETVLMSTLKKHGLERFDPSVAGDKFDPSRHEAVFQAPMKDKEDGSVFHTQSKGFLYNGRVLRAAKVGVTKNSS